MYMLFDKSVEFEELQGKVILSIENNENAELIFKTSCGATYKLYHEQDCCESVTIEDICGDLCDIIGSPLLLSEKVRHDQDMAPEGLKTEEYDDSCTWTFYKLGTKNGSITIRWYGTSNGYYSEEVDFVRVK